MALVEEFLREGGGAGEASTSAGGDGDGARGSTGLPEAFSFAASLFPLRSLALDAQVLDDSLGQQLRTEVSRATSLLPARTVLRVQAEVKLLVEVSVLALTVGLGRPTPGMEILSLRHQNRLSALQRALLCTVGPGSRWLAERFETLASSRNMAEAESGWELLAWRSYCFASLSSSSPPSPPSPPLFLQVLQPRSTEVFYESGRKPKEEKNRQRPRDSKSVRCKE